MFNKAFFSFLILASLVIVGRASAGGSTAEGGGDRPIGARALELAAARGCELGPAFYRMEEVMGANRPRMERVQYVCVGGVYRRNGFVPKYPRCIEGEDRLITEQETRGNHEREVAVRYTCRGGALRRNP